MIYQTRAGIPWPRINDFLLECGKICHPRDFCIQVLKRLDLLIPYDQGRVYFFDDGGTVINEFLVGVDPQIIKDYREYYSKVEGGRYSAFERAAKKTNWSICGIEESVHDWTAEEDDEFLTYHLRPQGIRYSFGLGMYDIHNFPQSICIFDRVSRAKYSDAEMKIMSVIRPHLNNLYRNFFFDSSGSNANGGDAIPRLTARESEISVLLCKGIKPAVISRRLFISLTTVYKHIAHIYEKLAVSNRQELLVKLYSGHFVRQNAPPLSSATVPAKWPDG
jgi:DNA-binding CsgD family transcriptional regulator